MGRSPKHPDLIAAIANYRAAHKISRSGFGELAMGDPCFLRDIELRGRELRRDTERRLWTYLSLTPDQIRAERSEGAA